VKKHVFGHISAQENALQAKTDQNDSKVNGFNQKKIGGDSWPYKIGRAVNVPDLPGAVASIPLEITGCAWRQIVAGHKLIKSYIYQLFDKHIGKIATAHSVLGIFSRFHSF
jgi:hypothetical protein